VALNVSGDCAGVPGQLERDLLVVAGREVRVLPREDGGDERFVRGAIQREFSRSGRGLAAVGAFQQCRGRPAEGGRLEAGALCCGAGGCGCAHGHRPWGS
jgi:hypothetical protein